MKKCPKCGRTYDDSWEVCLKCSKKLVFEGPLMPSKKAEDTYQESPKIVQNIIGCTVGLIFGKVASAIFKSIVFSVFPSQVLKEKASAVSTATFILFCFCFMAGYKVAILLWDMGNKK